MPRTTRNRRNSAEPKFKRRHALSRYHRSLRFEPLEDRRLLSITVNTLIDENDGVGVGGISLRDAIVAAASGDTIQFSASLTSGGPATITLTHGELLLNQNSLTVTGPGANLMTIDASGNDPTPTQNNGDGSRVLNIQGNGIVVINGLTITGGDSNSVGGGIYAYADQRITISDCVIRDNSSTFGGGGLYASGHIGGMPPVLFPASEVVVNNTTISNNSSPDSGGGIDAYVVRLTVSNSVLYGNTATGQGGGILCAGTTYQYGPNIFASLYAVLSVSDCTISGNSANGNGGGIYTTITVTTCNRATITANKADADINGSGQGGGISISGGPCTLSNTIVAGNLRAINTADDLNGSAAASYCIVGVNTGATITNNGGNQIGTSGSPIDPLLGPLVNNGGSMLTQALLPTSPAINAGDPAAAVGVNGVPQYDQRGTPWGRVVGGRIDMGAVESQPNPLPGDYNFNRVVEAGDYVLWRKLFSSATDLRADGSGNGTVDPADYDFWRARFGNTLGSGADLLAEAPGQPPSALGAISAELASDPPSAAAVGLPIPLGPQPMTAEPTRPPSKFRGFREIPPVSMGSDERDLALAAWLESQTDDGGAESDPGGTFSGCKPADTHSDGSGFDGLDSAFDLLVTNC